MWRSRIEALRRDVATVLADLRGQHPSPLITRPPSRRAFAPSATAAAARPMIVREVRRETSDATVIVLADATGAPVRFVPGQFLTLLVTVDGQVHRRAYSICSDVAEPGAVSVCARRIAGGRVSTYLHERLAVGDTIPVLGPSGEFTLTPDAAARRDLVLIAGGSGITPILAILRAMLAQEPGSRATLVYGNRRADTTIFRDALDALAGERLTVRHVLEDPPSAEGPGDVSPEGEPGASPRSPRQRASLGAYHVGRLDRATVARELDQIATTADTEYFVCGPAAAMAAVREELTARGVAPARIREERFATAERKIVARAAQRLSIRRAGVVTDVVVSPDATLLDAGLAAGVAMPYSCAMGGCGACAVHLVEGDVDLDEPNCLAPGERAAGRILACIARPTGPCMVEIP